MSQLLAQPHNTLLDNGLLLSPFILHNAAEIMDLKPSPTKFLFGSLSGFLLQTQTQTQTQVYPLLQTSQTSPSHSFLMCPGIHDPGPFPSLCVLSALHTSSSGILLPSTSSATSSTRGGHISPEVPRPALVWLPIFPPPHLARKSFCLHCEGQGWGSWKPELPSGNIINSGQYL